MNKKKKYCFRLMPLVNSEPWIRMKTGHVKPEGMKNITIVEPMVTIQSTVKPEDITKLEALAEAMLQ